MTAELTHVLLATGDPDTADAFRTALRPEDGFDLTEVGTAAEAIRTLEQNPHDVVVLDLSLPDARGLGTVAMTRSHARGCPVLVVADRSQESLALKAVRDGCADHLTRDQLYATVVRRSVRYAMERARSRRREERAVQALRESEQRYRSLFEQSRDAIYMTERSGEIVEVNGATLDLLGFEPGELPGRDVLSIYAEPSDRQRFRKEIEARGHVRDFEVRLRRKDGSEFWALVSGWVRRDPDGEILGYQGIIHDISSRKEVEDRLAYEAFHDTLTGLPNRSLFMDRLERAVARRRRGEERDLAVLFLDLDRFKVANDSLGHHLGDELLRQMGGLLEGEVREEDTVARIGGDEFAILLDGVDDASNPTHVAERIQDRLRKPFHLDGHQVFTSVSIGITFGGADVERAEDLLRDADTAMYRAKDLGPARYQIFDQAMHAHAVTLLQLETDMRLALERQEFVVHYHPILDTGERRLIGFEALIRWQHPSRGLLHPQAFLPVAEETGLIVSLGEWVLREAARQVRVWQHRGPLHRSLFVAVNVSERQVTTGRLGTVVERVLEETGLPPDCLRLELPEGVVMRHPDTTGAVLRQLRDMGVTLCLDDFGTGYSALNHLHHFPIDTLKIDRSFVARMTDRGDPGVVETIAALARNLGMHASAEGIETEEQFERLRALGPDSVQGYLFFKPLDEQAVSALLDDIAAETPAEAAVEAAEPAEALQAAEAADDPEEEEEEEDDDEEAPHAPAESPATGRG